MTTSSRSNAPARGTFAWPWIGLTLAVVVLLCLFPPFHVVSRQPALSAAPTGGAAFDPVAFVARFWSEQLQPAAGRAAALAPILAELRRDPAAAVQQHARSADLGGTAYFFSRGSGRVTAVEKSQVVVAVDGAEGGTIAIRTGPIFGNAVRDGCGLLEVNRVPGLAEFNAVSAELNRLVEERVLPPLRHAAKVGGRITFAGCAAAPDGPGAGALLAFIPVQAEVTP